MGQAYTRSFSPKTPSYTRGVTCMHEFKGCLEIAWLPLRLSFPAHMESALFLSLASLFQLPCFSSSGAPAFPFFIFYFLFVFGWSSPKGALCFSFFFFLLNLVFLLFLFFVSPLGSPLYPPEALSVFFLKKKTLPFLSRSSPEPRPRCSLLVFLLSSS